MHAQRFHDPLLAHDFSMEGEGGFGRVAGCWSKIGALAGEAEVLTYRCGDDPATMHKGPGLVAYEDVDCERGISPEDNSLAAWFTASCGGVLVANGRGDSAQGAPDPDFRARLKVSVRSKGGGARQASVDVVNAWCGKYELAELDAMTGAYWIATVSLVNEGVIFP